MEVNMKALCMHRRQALRLTKGKVPTWGCQRKDMGQEVIPARERGAGMLFPVVCEGLRLIHTACPHLNRECHGPLQGLESSVEAGQRWAKKGVQSCTSPTNMQQLTGSTMRQKGPEQGRRPDLMHVRNRN